jgi:hypothetical protein
MNSSRFNSLLLVGATVTILFASACSRSASSASNSVEAVATRQFWDTINEPFVTKSEIDTIRQLKIADPDIAHAQLVRNGFLALAQGARENSRRISALPLRDVDSNTALYAAKEAEHLTDLAGLCEAIGGRTASDAQVPVELTFGFLKSLIQHSNDRDGKLWGIAKDSGLAIGKAGLSSASEWQALAAKVNDYKSRGISLQNEEMALRASLTARFGRDFPPSSSYRHVIDQ